MNRLCARELCTGCGACAAACPGGCIRLEEDAEGFLRPVVQTESCSGCGLCQRACPIVNGSALTDGHTKLFAALHLDEQMRLQSTSGGVFTELCAWTLDRGGIVFGAAYDSDFRVFHCAVEKWEDIGKLRGAKYVQSDLGDSYSQVRTWLKAGRQVLFSGTPCQVGGLVSFLGKEYENLILVDLICHGVPSPKVWQHYLAYRSSRDGGEPVGINLRSKETGWPGYSIRFDYPGEKYYAAFNVQDPYLRGFVRNLYLRPSCYDCHFKGTRRLSDFTLGDYWGIWDQMPEYHDGKGTSLVLVHTDKGRAIWRQLDGQIRFDPAPAEALQGNPSALVSSERTNLRSEFWGRYENEDFTQLVETLCPPPPPPKKTSNLVRCIGKAKRMLKKLCCIGR